jgi:hypothetical protein
MHSPGWVSVRAKTQHSALEIDTRETAGQQHDRIFGPHKLRKVDIGDSVVTIDLSDSGAAPAVSVFEAEFVDEIGPDVRVVLE